MNFGIRFKYLLLFNNCSIINYKTNKIKIFNVEKSLN